MISDIVLPDGFAVVLANIGVGKIGALGLRSGDITAHPAIGPALAAMERMRRDGDVRAHGEKVYFPRLPYQERDNRQHLERIEAWGEQVRRSCGCLICLGIGGSYLGNEVLADALLSTYWNNFSPASATPRLFFSGNNLDPASVRSLERIVDLERAMFLVISKSGTTMETMAAFLYFYDLYRQRGIDPANHFTAVTDPTAGILLHIAEAEGFPRFEVPPGVGGRWSVLSDVGLLPAAACGIPVRELLRGARVMDEACVSASILDNPACLYAAVCHLLHTRHGIDEVVLMPYADALKSFALWYVQLLAESLGKERNRHGEIVHAGRTPIAAVGTTDMHAQTQQHREGKKNKLLTTITVESFGETDITLPDGGPWSKELSFVAGQTFSELLHAARRANEESLAADGRPVITISIPRLDAYTLGELFYFFELATAFEGELLDVNAFDQPGVEHYKKLMKTMLGS